jgi:Flp pilus assembly protein TadD
MGTKFIGAFRKEDYFMKAGCLKAITFALQINLAAILILANLPLVQAQSNRRIRISETQKIAPLKGRYFALLIAVSDFAGNSGIKSLDYPLQDAERVLQLLTSHYTFEPTNVTFLRNPNRATIIRTLDDLSQKLTEQDNLLIFYAGHGYWDTRINQGFWFPSDARRDDRAEWLSNSTLRDYISGIRTKHTLLVADACFSGGIFKTRAAFDQSPRAIPDRYKLPSRNAMTSGAMTEVPDKSVFVAYFLKRLKENREAYLSAETLFSRMREAVMNNSPTAQIPQYGEIREVGDEGGDFIFVRRNEISSASSTESPNRQGASLYLEDKFAEAESEYRKAVKSDPTNATLHNMLGAILKEQKRYKEAEKEFLKAVKLEPTKADWLSDLGQILEMQKKLAKAEAYYRQAVQLEPSNPLRYENLGRVLYLSTKYAEAASILKQAISKAPTVVGSRYYLGLTYISQKRYKEAETELKEVLRINPNESQAKKAIASLTHMN